MNSACYTVIEQGRYAVEGRVFTIRARGRGFVLRPFSFEDKCSIISAMLQREQTRLISQTFKKKESIVSRLFLERSYHGKMKIASPKAACGAIGTESQDKVLLRYGYDCHP